jgi:hypothetical protein
MKRVFVVRPFNTKSGIDFENVQAELIEPALQKAGLQGDTTTAILEAGSIRQDMFRLLLTADLVVADVSIHNANVFYELGIRHGLRPRATVMIRTPVAGHDYPFDLQTERYVDYDAAAPKQKVDELARALSDTAAGDRVDSPVYQLLPSLKPPDPALLEAVVPPDFLEEVQRAAQDGRRGDLRLMAYESRGFEWESEGLRVVGRAQFYLKGWQGARATFQRLRELTPHDIEANQRLATIYQRLGDLSSSAAAIERVLGDAATGAADRAEVLALRARNLKDLWRQEFASNTIDPAKVRALALQSPNLTHAQEAYTEAFEQDLNAYYPGINALSLLALLIGLAEAQPDVWKDMFDSDAQASERLTAAQAQFDCLRGAIQLALQAAQGALARERDPRPEDRWWLAITEADFGFLIGNRPRSVAQRYRDAITRSYGLDLSSVRAQLELFDLLDVRRNFAVEALRTLDELDRRKDSAARPAQVLLFTGHRVDAPGAAPGRKSPRFPNTSAAENEARRLIREAVEAEKASSSGEIIGVAGGASGGDILFHEICAELSIPTKLFLALPVNEFAAASVRDGGPAWLERYYRLVERVPPRVLADSEELPRWLQHKSNYDFWQRNNLWMLFNALAENARRLTLIALWDGGESEGPGGTKHLFEQAGEWGYKTVHLDARPLQALT